MKNYVILNHVGIKILMVEDVKFRLEYNRPRIMPEFDDRLTLGDYFYRFRYNEKKSTDTEENT